MKLKAKGIIPASFALLSVLILIGKLSFLTWAGFFQNKRKK
jgi:hypothetical protein